MQPVQANKAHRHRRSNRRPREVSRFLNARQELARRSHQDSEVRFVTVKSWPKKSHQDSAVRFVTAKSWLERATKTRQYDLLRPRVGQKEPPRLGSTICYGQELARKSHRDSAVRFVTAKRRPERATKTRQYDLLRPRVGQKESPRLGSTICLRPNVGQKEPPKLGSTICYGQELARKSHQDSAVRFVTAKRGPERATKTRQYDLLRPRVGQKEPPRLGSTICYGQTWARKSHRDSARPPPPHTQPICRAYPQPTLLEPGLAHEDLVKAGNSWARSKQGGPVAGPGARGAGGRQAWGRADRAGGGQGRGARARGAAARGAGRGRRNSWRKIRAQGAPNLAHEFRLAHEFSPAHEFSRLAHGFALPTTFLPCPRISPPCPRISPPCPRISLAFKLLMKERVEGLGFRV